MPHKNTHNYSGCRHDDISNAKVHLCGVVTNHWKELKMSGLFSESFVCADALDEALNHM